MENKTLCRNNSKIKFVERGKIDTNKTQIHDRSHSWHFNEKWRVKLVWWVHAVMQVHPHIWVKYQPSCITGRTALKGSLYIIVNKFKQNMYW